MTIIDSHAHLWQRDRTPQPWIDPVSMAVIDRDIWVDDLSAVQRATGIDGSIVVQSSNSTQETEDLLRAADADAIFGVIGWVDLEADVPAQLAHLSDVRGGEYLVGIRHLAHQDPDPKWLERPNLDFATLAAYDLVFDLVVLPTQLDSAFVAASANPRTRFVLDHLGKPPIASGELDEWKAGLARLAELDNTVVKLSGLTMEADWQHWTIDDLRRPVTTALELFGSHRVLFGSDWPLVDLSADLPTWLDTARNLVPDEYHDAVFRDNAERIYLGEPYAF